MSARIHPLAAVDPSARLGDGVVIGPFVSIGAEVEIGDGTEIGAHASDRRTDARSAARTGSIRTPAWAAIPQDLKFAGERVALEVGDRNVIREFVTFHRGTGKGGALTRVGDDSLFMVYSPRRPRLHRSATGPSSPTARRSPATSRSTTTPSSAPSRRCSSSAASAATPTSAATPGC